MIETSSAIPASDIGLFKSSELMFPKYGIGGQMLVYVLAVAGGSDAADNEGGALLRNILPSDK